MSRKNSSIWTYFNVNDSDKKIARCDLCGQLLSFRGTITNLKSHLNRKHPTINLLLESRPANSNPQARPNLGKKQNSDTNLNNDSCNEGVAGPSGTNIQSTTRASDTCQDGSDLPDKALSNVQQTRISTFIPRKCNATQKKKLDRLLLNLFTHDFQPFSIVEDRGFRAFVNELNPSYDIPSRKVISNNHLPAAFEKCKGEVVTKMKNAISVCLTTDCWSSSVNESYLALTAHFISDNYALESVLLDCKQIEGSHTSKHLANTIRSITDEFNISDKVILVVSDNAANIVGAVHELQWKHFGCFAHTINLVVHDALVLVQEIQEKAKNIVTFFRRSNLATEKLIKYQKDSGENQPKKLIQEVATRWNATFYMLERLVLLEDAIKSSLALSERTSLNLSSEEWKICTELIEVLRPFESVTRQISGEGYVTGSQVIVLTAGLLNVCSIIKLKPYHKTVINTVKELEKGVLTRMKNIESSKTAGICTFLDPRFKLHGFLSESSKTEIKKTVTELMTKNLNLTKNVNHEERINKKRKTEMEEGLSVWGLFDSIVAKQPETNSLSSSIVEVQRYLDEGILPRKNDPLQWWAQNHHHYPNLAKIVKERCCMVATRVPCERIFSKTGLLINERRTRLKSKKVRELIFLNANSNIK